MVISFFVGEYDMRLLWENIDIWSKNKYIILETTSFYSLSYDFQFIWENKLIICSVSFCTQIHCFHVA
jgi:hypothetical protein